MSRRVFSDFDAELLLRLGNRTDITSTQRGFFLNDALRMIVNEFAHPEYELSGEFTVQAGDYFLQDNGANDVDDIWWPMFVQDAETGRSIDERALSKIEAQLRVEGTITEYYWFNNTFFFNRIAEENTDLVIWYKKVVAEWSDGSPGFNQIYDPLIPMRAAQIALDTIGDQEAAHIQETAYSNYTTRMKLPKYEANRNDRRKGISVRTR